MGVGWFNFSRAKKYMLLNKCIPDQHTISQDLPSKNNEPDFSDKEEWPTEEGFEPLVLKLLKFSNGELFLMEYTEY